MNSRNSGLIKGAVCLVVIWAVIGLSIKLVRSAKPTAEKVTAYLADNDLSGISDEARRREVIGRTAEMLNAMDSDELEALNGKEDEDPRRKLFGELSSEEQLYFLERRIGRAFEQIMESFNAMERDERKKIVERSMKRIQERGGSGGPFDEENPEVAEQITDAGLKAYYSTANAETKIDLAPLLEEMQRTIAQGGRGR
ncbi:hypothetical protein VSU19_04740 [Verrucomicrobiales bacterium BCK34]|nr:hypothetical protein [Verrucomicrobiales bacterium BCK34]